MSEIEKIVQVNIEGNTIEAESEGEHDPHFEPIICLPEVAISTLEEEEIELIKMRAKLFRYDTNENPPEWKERGTGEAKLLQHKVKNTVRVVMRRDKTLKICANHYVTPFMELKTNCGSDRAWVWSVVADFADETARPELLAIRFANADNAKKWKEMFEEAKHIVATQCDLYTKTVDELISDNVKSEDEDSDSEEEEEEDKVAETMEKLALNEGKEVNGETQQKKPENSPDKTTE